MTDRPAPTESSGETYGELARFYFRKLQRNPAVELVRLPLRRAQWFLPSMWRLATHQFRQFPTVIIAGAQKAGTTQLYAYLIKHPRILSAWKKEVNYFSKRPHRSVQWYRSRFPLRSRVRAAQGHVLEASPSYLPMPAALCRMAALVPETRVIAILRDPVSRAFSHYQHQKCRGMEARSFGDAVNDLLRDHPFPPDPGVALQPGAAPMLDYLSRGYYGLQLELLLALYPRDRVLVIDSSKLFADTNSVCQCVFSFLGLEPYDIRLTKVYNRGYYREQIDPRVVERLREHYRRYDELLAEVTGQQFSWMASAKPIAA